MKPENKYVAAIDIGGSKVVVAVGEALDSGEVKIVAAYSAPMDGEAVRNGEVRNVINLQNNIRKCLDNIREEEGFIVEKAVVNLSGAHVMCVDFEYTLNIRDKGKQVTQRDIDDLYQEAVNKHTYDNYFIVDIIPQAYYVDGAHVTSPLGTIGKKIKGEFCVVVCDRTSKEVFDGIFRALDVTPVNYTLSSLASAEAVLLDDEREYGVAMIDIGSDCCDIVVYKDNIPCDVGVVPLGGRNINEDIASLNVLPRYIEKIKVDYGRALTENAEYYQVISLPIKSDNINKRVVVRELCGVIEARVREIAEEVKGFLEEGGRFHGLGAGIVLTGGTSKLQDIEAVFRDVTGYDNVVTRYPNRGGQENSEILNDPEYSTVAGLLQYAKYYAEEGRFRNGVRQVGQMPVEEKSEGMPRMQPGERVEPDARKMRKNNAPVSGRTLFDEEEDDIYENDDPVEEKTKSGFGRFFKNIIKEPKDNVNDLDE